MNKHRGLIVPLVCFLLSALFPLQNVDAAEKIKVAIIGSSSFVGGCGPNGFKKDLEDALSNREFTCFAKSGAGASYFLQEYNAQVKGKGYSEIILYAGLNGLGTKTGLNAAQQNLTTLLQSAQNEGIKVIVTSAQPFKGYSTWTAVWGENIKENNEWLAGQPHGVDAFVDLYSKVDKNGDDVLDSEYDSGDHLHLNSKGQELLGKLILQAGYGQAGGIGSAFFSPTSYVNELQLIVKAPQTQITIPGLKFSNPADVQKSITGDATSGRFLAVPYLAEYLVAMYRYSVAAVSIIAVVMIIVAGYRLITGAGSGEAFESAKHMIVNALTGLTIAVGSYTILYTINPDLVSFQHLSVLVIPGETLSTYDKGGLVYSLDSSADSIGAAKPLSSSDFDPLFQKYASCTGVDWGMLKAIAYVESRFNHTVVNSLGFTGLFQTKEKFCVGALKKYTPQAKTLCKDLKNPEVSTMVGAAMLASSVEKIQKACPTLDGDSALYFMYLGHHSGQGTLGAVLKKTCDYTKAPDIAHAFWSTRSNGRFADAPGKKRTATHIVQEGNKAALKVASLAKGLGVSGSIQPVNTTACPLTNNSL